MSRQTLLIAVAAIAAVLVGMIVIAQDRGPAPATSTTETRIDAPGARVESNDTGTTVNAPGTSVDTDASGTRIQAPGVDITVPRRDND